MKLADITPADLEDAAATLRPSESVLGADLELLLRFGQRGSLAARARQRLYRVMLTLFASPGADIDPLHARLHTPDATSAPEAACVVAVVRAARARLCLATEEAVDVADLAVLCGLDASTVRLMARQGKLHRTSSAHPRPGAAKPGRNAPITAASALALLRERHVAPWGGPPS